MACVPTVPTSSDWPSGADFATASAPIEPPAPPRLSATTVALRFSPSICANGRATMSVGPPAGNGITTRICFPANICACAGAIEPATRAEATAAATPRNSLRRIRTSPRQAVFGSDVKTSKKQMTSSRQPRSARAAGRQIGKSLGLHRRPAFDERLAALHLVGQRRLIDLDHHVVGIDAKVLHQRLRDVAHHAGLLLIGAAGGHAHGDLGHLGLSLLLLSSPGKARSASSRQISRPSTIVAIKQEVDDRYKPGHDTWLRIASPTSRHAGPAPRAPWRRSRLPCTRTAQAGFPAIPGWRRSRRRPWRPRSDP